MKDSVSQATVSSLQRKEPWLPYTRGRAAWRMQKASSQLDLHIIISSDLGSNSEIFN